MVANMITGLNVSSRKLQVSFYCDDNKEVVWMVARAGGEGWFVILYLVPKSFYTSIPNPSHL